MYTFSSSTRAADVQHIYIHRVVSIYVHIYIGLYIYTQVAAALELQIYCIYIYTYIG